MANSNKRGIAAIGIIIAISVLAAVVGIVSDRYLGDDNPVEQEAEKIIKDETGMDVDLSPEKGQSK